MFDKMYKNLMSLVVVVLALILIIFFAAYNSLLPEGERFVFNKSQEKGRADKIEEKSLKQNFLDDNFFTHIQLQGKGNKASGNYITVLSDYACPWSNKFYRETISPFLQQANLSDVWLQYDFLALGSNSPTLIAAEASYCANEQNMFWQMHEKMFNLAELDMPLEQAFSKENINKVAEKIGLSQKHFSECLESQKYRELIIMRANYYLDSFDRLGVPATFINGYPVTLFIEGKDQMVGAIDFNTFVEKVNEMKQN